MINKVLVLLVIAAVAGVTLGGLWLLSPGGAYASNHSAVRSFSQTSVAPGDTVTVTIVADNYGRLGRIVETVPSGFTTGDGSSQTVNIRLLAAGPQTSTYTVTATDSPGAHAFSGTISNDARESRNVGGATTVTVTGATGPGPSPTPTATRSISPASVSPGGQFTVTIRADNYGRLGRIMETVPDGFDITTPETEGQTVTLRLLQAGPQTVTYTVTAPEATGGYTISGSLEDSERSDHTVTGASRITVREPAPPSPDDPCLDTLSVDVPVNGEWIINCESTARDSYARYYRFTLTEESTVIITLESSIDPYLYLRAGEAKSGTAAYENDDVVPGTDTNSEIQATLGIGTYTIEATTYGAEETGSFTLGVGTVTMPGPSDDPCLDTLSVDVPVNGEWIINCESTARDSYARYYRFTLTEESTVIITLESSIDPYLYLRAGEAKSGTAAYENDDVVPGTDTNSEIQATLGIGTYTIEATTYGAEETGSFTLGVGTVTMPGPSPDDPCLDTLSVDVPVNGEWIINCESTARDSYARYYRFTLTEESTVIITLESSIDPYLYLRAGEAKSGTAAYENDDVVPGTDTNSEIQATLGIGTYTIEATTYGAEETGSFTLTVSGL